MKKYIWQSIFEMHSENKSYRSSQSGELHKMRSNVDEAWASYLNVA